MSYEQEKITPYNTKGSKGKQVERMFDHIAHSYDRLNHILSMGIDRHWRKAAVRELRPFCPRQILDVATGTGDFAFLMAHDLEPESLLGIDLSEGMMEIARKKAAKRGVEKTVTFRKDDCMALSLKENTFDAVTVAYGVRNFEDLERGLSEMRRVLRGGGHLVILELTTPRRFPFKQLFFLYSHLLLPFVGSLVSRDRRAYSYLPQTMEAFPQPEELCPVLKRIGFREVKFRRFTFGLSTLYCCTK